MYCESTKNFYISGSDCNPYVEVLQPVPFDCTDLSFSYSIIYFPYPFGALSFKKKPYDSIGVLMAMDALYPRQLLWHGTEQQIPGGVKGRPKFQVAFKGWKYDQCKTKMPKKTLGHYDWQICQLD